MDLGVSEGEDSNERIDIFWTLRGSIAFRGIRPFFGCILRKKSENA